METMEAVFKRRSIRAFTPEKIKEDDIKTILKAAMMAPTARNAQEWEFLVIRNKQTMIKLTEALPHAKMLPAADAAIVVCGNTNREITPGYWIGDCGAATQNILLAATELGLGSVWLGVQAVEERRKKLKEILALPAEIEPFNVIALGYPAEEKESLCRYDEDKVHYEEWGKKKA